MKQFLFSAFFALTLVPALRAEDLQFHCVPRDDRETPYRTFDIQVFNADSEAPQSEVSFAKYADQEALNPDATGMLTGFARNEVYQTQVTSRYRMIRIEGGDVLSNFERDVLQLQRRSGSEYKGLFEFPEGSDELDLSWNSTLVLVCERL